MGEKGTEYFRQLVSTTTADFTELSKKWKAFVSSEPDISDDALGQILATVGQSELLMRQRFYQFTGLIDSCEFQTGEKKTLPSDLQGFWDMIYFQVEDVHQRFKMLDHLQKNNWKPEVEKKRLFVKKTPSVSKSLSPQTKGSSSVKAHVLAAKKRLAEAKLRIKSTSSEDGGEENKENVKVFEAPGFFVINSPVKNSPSSKAKGGIRLSNSSPIVSKLIQKSPASAKKYITLSCVTRSAKQALQEKNNLEDFN